MNETAEYERAQTVQLGVETSPAHLNLSCHVNDDTALSFRTYPEDERLTFQIGVCGAAMTLFAYSEALDRLIFALIGARNHLNAEVRNLYPGPDTPIVLFPTD